jgi:alpha-methylacyl-CoA racemase
VAALKPLDGVRVLDLTRLLPGAYATLMFADLGAEVIKIEDPRGGDPGRTMPPLANGTSASFELLNRNKRSVTLDLRSPDASAILDALIARADVLVDSFRPQTARRLRVDAATMRARHPRLICASITGFGQSGPYVEQPAHDINYEALSGLLAIGGRPEVPRHLVADIGAALNAASGILAALFQRERTGFGAAVDVALHEAALAWLLFPAAGQLVAGADADSRALPITGADACYNIYETKHDGERVALGAIESKFWSAFCGRIGRPDLAAAQQAGGEARARALDEVRAIMRTRSRDEWLALFPDLDVCLCRVNSVAEALADPHVVARGAVTASGGTTYITTPITITSTGSPAEWDAARRYTVAPAPVLGADTEAVLDAAGIDEMARLELRRRGII